MTSQNQHERAQSLDQIRTDMPSQAETQRDVTTDKTPLSADISDNLGIADIPPKEVRYTLSTDDLVHDFRVAGITKNKRTITRYLEKGLIDAAKLDSGAWVANAISAADFIEDKKRQEAMAMELTRDRHKDALRYEARHVETGLDMSADTVRISEKETEPLQQNDESTTVDLKIENASLKAQNEQLQARLADKDSEIDFARQQVLEANRAAERAHTESYQYKALLASRDEQFRPMINSISELSRSSARDERPAGSEDVATTTDKHDG